MAHLLRLNDWWNEKVPWLLGFMYYVFLWNQVSIEDGWLPLLLLIAWIFFAASFGYFINDCFDIKQDLAAGKKNFAASLSLPVRIIIAIILLAGIVAPYLFLPLASFVYPLIVLHILLFLLYSIPPVRIKERLYFGVLFDSLYAYVIPALIASFTAYAVVVGNPTPLGWDPQETNAHLRLISIPPSTKILIAVLISWTFFAGLRNILQHHLHDRRKDAMSNTKNVFNHYGPTKNIQLISKYILPIELVLYVVFILMLGEIAWYALPIFVLFLLTEVITFKKLKFHSTWKHKLNYGLFSVNLYYEKWLPLIILVFLAVKVDKRYGIFIVFHYYAMHFLFTKIIRPAGMWAYINLIKRFWYHVIVFIWHMVILRSLHFLRLVASRIVNYSIYYFCVLFRIPIKKEERTETPKEVKIKEEQIIREEILKLDLPDEITPDNKIVNGLWIGTKLSNIELLTIQTFLDQGHQFNFWVYDEIETPLPEGVTLKDANEVLHNKHIFRYKYPNAFGHGKGSVAGYSDVFRYKMLLDHGGWWVDMDCSCLKPLNFQEDYFFRAHHELIMVGNVMKCPPGSELMQYCFDRAFKEIDENNRDWHKPIVILNDGIEKFNLTHRIMKGVTNEDRWDEVKEYVIKGTPIPDHYFALHWMNEEWRSKNIDKKDIRQSSTLGKLMLEKGIIQPIEGSWNKFKHEMRHAVVNRVIIEYG